MILSIELKLKLKLKLLLLIILLKLFEIKCMSFIEEPKDIETIVGSNVLFRCRTNSLNENEINWCKNDFCTMGKSRDLPFYPRYEIIGEAKRGEHHFKIINVSLEDQGVYQCQILAQSNRSASLSRKAKLNILEKPTSLKIEKSKEIVENIPSSLLCRCECGNSPSKLIWSIPSTIEILSENEFVLIHNEYRRETISNLTIRTNRSSTNNSIQCSIQSNVLSLINETFIVQQFIDVLHVPQIRLESNGNDLENEFIRIRCEILSNPRWNSISWIDENNRIIEQQTNEIQLKLTRSMNSKRIFCQSTNSIGTENQSILLRVIYRPVFHDEFGLIYSKNISKKNFDENISLKLKCFVDSNPSLSINWFYKSNLIETNKTTITIDKGKHRDIYICSVVHPHFGQFNHSFLLIQNGPPEMFSEENDLEGSIGDRIVFHCFIFKENLLKDFFWFRQSKSSFRLQSNEKYQIEQIIHDDYIDYQLFISNLNFNDEDQFICSSENSFGSSKISFQLKIRSKHLIKSKIFYLIFFLIFVLISIGFLLFVLIKYHRSIFSSRHNRLTSIEQNSSSTNQKFSSNQNEYFLSQYPTITLIDRSSIEPFLLSSIENSTNKYSTVV